MKTILSLKSQSWDIAQCPEIANQLNCAILGGSCVAYTKYMYTSPLNTYGMIYTYDIICIYDM